MYKFITLLYITSLTIIIAIYFFFYLLICSFDYIISRIVSWIRNRWTVGCWLENRVIWNITRIDSTIAIYGSKWLAEISRWVILNNVYYFLVLKISKSHCNSSETFISVFFLYVSGTYCTYTRGTYYTLISDSKNNVSLNNKTRF